MVQKTLIELLGDLRTQRKALDQLKDECQMQFLRKADAERAQYEQMMQEMDMERCRTLLAERLLMPDIAN